MSSMKSRKISKELDRMMEIKNNDETPWPLKNKITLTMLWDVYRCYSDLGYKLGDNSDEELGILLFAANVSDPGFNLQYDNRFLFIYKTAKTVRGVFDTAILVNNQTKLPKGQFMLQNIYENVDKERMSQYMVHLYRFASAIAKADGTVDEHESEVLANLMKAKDLTTDGKPLFEEEQTKENKESNDESSDSPEENKPMQQLQELIGLQPVKDEVAKLTNLIKVQQMREKKGLKTTPVSYHCVFTGNPGTGKTTVARILASIYKELGILKKGQLVETDRSGLVAEYVGQTAVKTNKIIDSALDGVLFIDEAYSLVQGTKNDYGSEAISTLLKRMEDDRNRLIVILAGYSDEMKTFIDSNPGLQSRFNRYINFEDYSSEDLMTIFELNLKKNEYVMADEAKLKIQEYIDNAIAHKDANFGNARFVRNLFEKVLENQATRLASVPNITKKDLVEITTEDIIF